jgi:hypothetical protein
VSVSPPPVASRHDGDMAKQITHEMTYHASPAQVSAMLGDADFRRAVCERQGVLRSEVDVTLSGEGKHVRIEQFQAAHGIPSFARKFVGDEIHIVQEEAWRSADHADVTVTIPGKPGDMTGTATLTEAGHATRERVEMTVRVAIPLVGGKIEGLIADLLLKALRSEEQVGQEWLARER